MNFNKSETITLGLAAAGSVGFVIYSMMSKKKNSPYDLKIDGYRNLTQEGEYIEAPVEISAERDDTIELVLSYSYFGEKQENVLLHAAFWVEGNIQEVDETDTSEISITLEKSFLPKRYKVTVPIKIRNDNHAKYGIYFKIMGIDADPSVVELEDKLVDKVLVSGEGGEDEEYAGFENPVITLLSEGPFMPGDLVEFEFQYAYSGDYSREVDVKLQLGKKTFHNFLGIDYTAFQDLYAVGETYIKYIDEVFVNGDEYLVMRSGTLQWHIPSQDLIDEYAAGQNLDVSVIITNRGMDWDWEYLWETWGPGTAVMKRILENVIPLNTSLGYYFTLGRPVPSSQVAIPGETIVLTCPVTNNSAEAVSATVEVEVSETADFAKDITGTYSRTVQMGSGESVSLQFQHLVKHEGSDSRDVKVTVRVNGAICEEELFREVFSEGTEETIISIGQAVVTPSSIIPGGTVSIKIPVVNGSSTSKTVTVETIIDASGGIPWDESFTYSKETIIPGNSTKDVIFSHTDNDSTYSTRRVQATVISGGQQVAHEEWDEIYTMINWIDFTIETPQVSALQVAPGESITITCPVTNKVAASVPVTVYITVYEGGFLGIGEQDIKTYTKTYTMSPNQRALFVVNHIAQEMSDPDRGVRVEVYFNGESSSLWQNEYPNLYEVRGGEVVQEICTIYPSVSPDPNYGYVQISPLGIDNNPYGAYQRYNAGTQVTLKFLPANPAVHFFKYWYYSVDDPWIGLGINTNLQEVTFIVPSGASRIDIAAMAEYVPEQNEYPLELPPGAPPPPATNGDWYWVIFLYGVGSFWYTEDQFNNLNPSSIALYYGPYPHS